MCELLLGSLKVSVLAVAMLLFGGGVVYFWFDTCGDSDWEASP